MSTGTSLMPYGVGGQNAQPTAASIQSAYTQENPQLQNIEQQQAAMAGIPAPTMSAAQLGNANIANAPGVSQTGAAATAQALQQLGQQSTQGSVIAQQQFQQALDQAQKQQIGSALAGGGRNGTAALYQAMQNQAGQSQLGASNSAIQTAQEKMAATQALGQLGGNVQAQNLAQANYLLGARQFNVGQENQFLQQNALNQQAANTANLQSAQAQEQIKQQALNQAVGTTQQESANIQNYQQLAAANWNAYNAAQAGVSISQNQQTAQLGASTTSLAGSLGAASITSSAGTAAGTAGAGAAASGASGAVGAGATSAAGTTLTSAGGSDLAAEGLGAAAIAA